MKHSKIIEPPLSIDITDHYDKIFYFFDKGTVYFSTRYKIIDKHRFSNISYIEVLFDDDIIQKLKIDLSDANNYDLFRNSELNAFEANDTTKIASYPYIIWSNLSNRNDILVFRIYAHYLKRCWIRPFSTINMDDTLKNIEFFNEDCSSFDEAQDIMSDMFNNRMKMYDNIYKNNVEVYNKIFGLMQLIHRLKHLETIDVFDSDKQIGKLVYINKNN